MVLLIEFICLLKWHFKFVFIWCKYSFITCKKINSVYFMETFIKMLFILIKLVILLIKSN